MQIATVVVVLLAKPVKDGLQGAIDRAFYRDRRVAITGGLGFIGSNLARQLVSLGADVLLIETQQDILETRAAIHGIRLAFDDMGTSVPIQAQVALDQTGRMLLGTDVGTWKLDMPRQTFLDILTADLRAVRQAATGATRARMSQASLA